MFGKLCSRMWRSAHRDDSIRDATLNFGDAPRSWHEQGPGRSTADFPAVKDALRTDQSAQAVFADDVQGRMAVVEEQDRPVPVAGEVAKLLADPRFGRHASACSVEPDAEVRDQRGRAGHAGGEARVGDEAADLGLDLIELGDAAQALFGDRGRVAVEDFAQLAASTASVLRVFTS
jgi:hypothetical protein